VDRVAIISKIYYFELSENIEVNTKGSKSRIDIEWYKLNASNVKNENPGFELIKASEIIDCK
jgi:hypothetical protein